MPRSIRALCVSQIGFGKMKGRAHKQLNAHYGHDLVRVNRLTSTYAVPVHGVPSGANHGATSGHPQVRDRSASLHRLAGVIALGLAIATARLSSLRGNPM